MRKFLILIALNFSIFGADVPVDCVAVFEARKDEIRLEVDKLDEAKQALEAFKASTQSLYEEQNSKITAREAEVNATLSKVEKEKKEIQDLVKKNEEILSQLKSMTMDKVGEAYGKMKDQAAADVLSAMDRVEAASIMYALSPKKISAIIGKMAPQIASEITLLLKKGPPFNQLNLPKLDKMQDGPAGNLLNL
ncbi:MAG: MotE family protein [Campylobacter sp.]